MTRAINMALALIITCAATLSSAARGQETSVSSPPPAASSQSGTKRALILCGLSGDAAHQKLFTETVSKLHAGLSQHLGFATTNIQVLLGDPAQDVDPEVIKSAGQATRDELAKAVAGLREKLRPEDSLWVIVLGHSHYDGKHSWLNLPGPDMQQYEFGKLFADLPAREQVFVITTPASGFYIKPLSAKGRVVITATEADWETNETEFPHELARVLTTPAAPKDVDIDGDGATTLFDLYLAITRNLAQSYVEREFLSTEHALLDDNADGRGTDVQIDYLTTEQGGRAKPNKPQAITRKPNSDGALSSTIRIALPIN